MKLYLQNKSWENYNILINKNGNFPLCKIVLTHTPQLEYFQRDHSEYNDYKVFINRLRKTFTVKRISTIYRLYQKSRCKAVILNAYNESNHGDNISAEKFSQMLHNCYCEEQHFIKRYTATKNYKVACAMHQSIMPSYQRLLNNTQSHFLKYYDIRYVIQDNTTSDNRCLLKNYVFAGQHHYRTHIALNIHTWTKYIDSFTAWKKQSLRKIFWHEIGHAIDSDVEQTHYFKGNLHNDIVYKISVHLMPQIIKAYKNMKKYNLPYKHKKYISYFLYPEKYYCYDKNNYNRIAFDYHRVAEEVFAESMSYLLHWFMDEKSSTESLFKTKKSQSRSMIKCLLPVMQYLLKNMDWSYVGVPQHIYYKRKSYIKNILHKIQDTPIIK